MKEKRYINRDERLGPDPYEFTMPEMIRHYRAVGWDVIDGETMTDDEIVEEVLGYNVEEIDEVTA